MHLSRTIGPQADAIRQKLKSNNQQDTRIQRVRIMSDSLDHYYQRLRHPHQVDSARTRRVLASGALPSDEPVQESFLADDDNEFSELREAQLGDDFQDQAGRASVSSTSKPSAMKPTSTLLSKNRKILRVRCAYANSRAAMKQARSRQ
jgi:hypothetical protein